MTSIIKLHALSGAMDESPPCYLLQIDEVRILLDCGWDEKFDPNFIKEIKRYVGLNMFPDRTESKTNIFHTDTSTPSMRSSSPTRMSLTWALCPT